MTICITIREVVSFYQMKYKQCGPQIVTVTTENYNFLIAVQALLKNNRSLPAQV